MSLNPVFLLSGGFTQALQLLAAISFLVILHEFGHFFFARLFKTRVEKFYLFFDVKFSLLKKKIGETEYGIGWLPLGGYVKIAGMVDESMDTEALAQPAQPWEFRSKKAWQRLLIMLGGIMMNVIIAIVLYVVVFSIWGEEYIPMSNLKNGITVDSIGRSIGLQNGDMIRAIDDKPITRYNEIPIALILHKENGTISITRNGHDTDIKIPFGTIGKIISVDRNNFVKLRVPATVDSVIQDSVAKIDLQKGDSIIAMNGNPIRFNSDYYDNLEKFNGQKVTLTYVRNNKIDSTSTVLQSDKHSILFGPLTPYIVKVKYTPITAISRGTSYTMSRLRLYVAQFKLFRSPEVKMSKSMGGFISMGKMYSPEFDWYSFLMMTAFISVALAFMNLLPVPGLDGGYVIFLLFEMITGKKVSEKVMERATMVGLILILSLMLYVNGLDILKLLHINI